MKNALVTAISSLLIYILLSIPLKPVAQQLPASTINWSTFETVKEQKNLKPRPILVFFYNADDDTSNLMLNTTLSNEDICSYINAKFYPIKFDIKSEADINFLDGKVYKKNPSKPYHDLATLLLGETPYIPTIIEYNDKALGFSFNGFKNQYDMLCMLIYIAENADKNSRYDLWAPAYFKTFPPGRMQNRVSPGIHWISLDEALRRNKETPKKIFLTWFTKWNASSSVFLVNTLNHPKIVEYMDQNFYCVRLDAQTTDTLFWDKTFVNKNESHKFHEMALSMMNGKMQFPSYFYFDSHNKIILNDHFYLNPDSFYILSNFVGSESYKKEKLADFLKTFKFDWQTQH